MATNTGLRTLSIAAMAALMGLAASAEAQVAPPPPPAGPAEPAYEPPPRPQARPAQARPQQPQRDPNRQRRLNLPEMQYVPMAQYDDQGRPLTVYGNLEVIALTHNPTVGQTTAPRLLPVYAARMGRLEERLITNLDLFRRLESGGIDSLDATDITALTQITETIRPLVEPQSLSQDWETAGVLSEIQGGFNRKILNEYVSEQNRRFNLQGGNDAAFQFLKTVLNDALRETREAHESLIAEALPALDDRLAASGLTGDPADALRSLRSTGLSEDPAARAAQLEAAAAAMLDAPIEQHAAFLSGVRNARPDPAVAPVAMPNLDQHGKRSEVRESFRGEFYTPQGTFQTGGGEVKKISDEIGPAPKPGQVVDNPQRVGDETLRNAGEHDEKTDKDKPATP